MIIKKIYGKEQKIMQNQSVYSNMFRLLNADEIECRIGVVGKTGVSLLLYKDARVDAKVLDETVGPFNWQKSYSRDNQNCTVSLWDAEKQVWVSKEDVGVESNMEKEKGLASDSFKRACFAWGLGRELYSAPFIFVPVATHQSSVGGKTVYKMDDPYQYEYEVTQIGYDENRKINKLVIADAKTGSVLYEFPKKATKGTVKAELKTEAKAEAKPAVTETPFTEVSLPECLNYSFTTGAVAGKKGSDFVLDVKSEKSTINALTKLAGANVGNDSNIAKNILNYIKNKKIQVRVKAIQAPTQAATTPATPAA